MEREALSSIMERDVRLLNAGDGTNIEIRCAATDALLATVGIDDLFDVDGNRFHNDLD